MRQTWRWFGPGDPVTLGDIRQAGAAGVVTALHEIANGAVWPRSSIAARRAEIEAAGLTWDVVESIPVHEDIKTGAPGWDSKAQAWAQTLRHLAAEGVGVVCYNFMPVLDWTRTDLDFVLPCGARALRFDFAALAAFDLFVLERPGARYSDADIAAARACLPALDRARLTRTVLAGLPGAEEHYTLETFRARLAAYAGIGPRDLRRRLKAFLDIVVPVAEAEGVRLALHPDDPPLPLFGLPRIVSTEADLAAVLAMHDAPCHGLTFCTGSLGARAGNDLAAMARRFAPRIHFAHLRAVRREAEPRSFHEDDHLGGDGAVFDVVAALIAAEDGRGAQIPMRPDHGHRICDDLRRETAPGYPLIGRLRGLAELRGVEAGLRHRLQSG